MKSAKISLRHHISITNKYSVNNVYGLFRKNIYMDHVIIKRLSSYLR